MLYAATVRRMPSAELDLRQRAPPQHIVHVRQHFAERKPHLVRIEQAREHEGDQLGGGSRRRAAGFQDQVAARVVVRDQLVDARVQPGERQIVPRQHQHIRGDGLLQRSQRPQIFAERIAFRIDRGDADIGGNLGQHLVGREEQLLGPAPQHDLLRRMAAAGQHVEVAAADAQYIAGDDAAVGRRQPRHQSEVAMSAGDDTLGGRGVEPVLEVEAAVMLRFERAGIEVEIQTDQVFRRRHVQRHAEPLQQKADRADVIRMHVGGDDARQRAFGQQAVEQRLPRRLGRLVAEAGVEQRPAIAVVDEIDVDVIEQERQRQPGPQNPGCHLDRRAGCRRYGVGKDDRRGWRGGKSLDGGLGLHRAGSHDP